MFFTMVLLSRLQEPLQGIAALNVTQKCTKKNFKQFANSTRRFIRTNSLSTFFKASSDISAFLSANTGTTPSPDAFEPLAPDFVFLTPDPVFHPVPAPAHTNNLFQQFM